LEEAAAIVDARQPRTLEKVGAEDTAPQLLDDRNFGEEPMAADVEAEAAVLLRARQAADTPVLFEDDNGFAARGQLVCRGESRGAGTDDDNRMLAQ
jgi:hypothetical protein